MSMTIENLVDQIRGHRCYSHPVFRHWASVRPSAEAALPAPAGTWVLARCEGSADSWTAALAAALKRRGARVATLEVSPADNRASLAGRLTALSLPADATVVSLAAGRASLIPAIPTAARLGSGTT